MGLLDGKVIAITGAGRGIGRALALECAAQGGSVVVNDFGGSLSGEGADHGPAQAVVAEIQAAGGKAIANLASVSDPEGAASIVEDAIKTFGRIDSVVNNAGVSRDGMFHKMSHENWLAVIDVHVNGSFYLSRAAAPHFRDQKSGSFVFMTSTSGLIGNVGQSNYSAAKMALVGLSNSLALDFKRYGIRSNCVAPFAWSRMTESIPAETPEAQERVERLKTMTSDKVAPMVAFLCSDASSEISGEVFCVRKNEIFLFNPMRPIRSVHRSEGWTTETVANEFLPAIRPSLRKLEVSSDVFAWDPI
ncbi:SDR family oxidoreductase [Croceicoccus sp. BE223]|uniref:SDR family oxidoreductase n=1 Tax=Croceicoccus sp. BE223 TaxID=2817716 RepID=UPI0028650BD1|nr:SDR family oxidoreductase [Croceicoccus sp. BE223]MDR7103677.1 NAD(P)-dependent dehydrogenase (short-subunit alcohol dehydrogenase family) [Croceicoccus sp. BE223]